MRWFGSGKKKKPGPMNPAAPGPTAPQPIYTSPKPETDIVVYGIEEDSRCRALRELLDQSGFVYRDERVDEDLSTRAWLQRTIGDDALPKLFLGARYVGNYEDVLALALNEDLKRVLSGEAAREEQDRELLKAQMSVSSIIQLLKEEESLVINADGVETETWLEPPRNPTQILLEGEPHPIEEMEPIVTRIVERHKKGEISLGWRSDEK